MKIPAKKSKPAEKIKPVFEGMEKKIGAVPNVFRAMAHNPEMLEAFLALNATLPKTQLDGKLRELAYIKTSELNGCDYCLHHHRGMGKKAGLNDRQLAETANFGRTRSQSPRDILAAMIAINPSIIATMKSEMITRPIQ